ncbi:hypothetical protein [Gallaecimonas pentaromativorans]|uniref:Protein FliT n=1 Tax=Gallaecimonas pentaromativorans TaxID=584787 RepID=A0A3N1P2B7_9GAMM|nr:hypothetical protein [Gallaecimonas pentaromativorans]MED5526706.1 hypothetical protein [Pseudomonadota bacterium]ROQ22605.1 hypothetical protein EDC28_10991 [Gallaecimonas pentaromativorans]
MASFEELLVDLEALQTSLASSFQDQQWQLHSQQLSQRQPLLNALHQAALQEEKFAEFRVVAEKVASSDRAFQKDAKTQLQTVESNMLKQKKSAKAIKNYMSNAAQN